MFFALPRSNNPAFSTINAALVGNCQPDTSTYDTSTLVIIPWVHVAVSFSWSSSDWKHSPKNSAWNVQSLNKSFRFGPRASARSPSIATAALVTPSSLHNFHLISSNKIHNTWSKTAFMVFFNCFINFIPLTQPTNFFLLFRH
jgi:hypothetical protein